jgi:phosphatidylglycerophosphate synthase
MGRLSHNLPNILTVAGLCSLPLIVWTYGLYAPGAAWPTAALVLIAALSDVADGLAARRLHVTSRFGRWADPIVDRVFFFTIIATLWYYGTLPWLAVLPLLIRDALMLALAIPFHRRTAAAPRPSRLGKAANFILICALQWFIIDVRGVGWAFFLVGATLYVFTGLQYGYFALTSLRATEGRRAAS